MKKLGIIIGVLLVTIVSPFVVQYKNHKLLGERRGNFRV